MTTPEDIYLQFFRADCAKDANAWAAVLNYPHVRVAAMGRTEMFNSSDQFVSQASWSDREETGWVRTEGIEPSRIFESEDLVFLNAGWTRMNAKDEPILQNRVVYVMTRIKKSWGVQARFACGAMPHWQASDDLSPVELVSRFVSAMNRNQLDAAAGTLQFPCVQVEVGNVELIANETELAKSLSRYPARKDGVIDVQAIQNGPIGANVAATWDLESGQVACGVFLLRKEPNCAILAMSLISSDK